MTNPIQRLRWNDGVLEQLLWLPVPTTDDAGEPTAPIDPPSPSAIWALSRAHISHLPMNKSSGQQAAFLLCWSALIQHINAKGKHYVTGGDLYRDSRVHGEYGEKASYSSAHSNHKVRKAGDLNLLEYDGTYVDSGDDHRPYGEWWEELGKRLGLPLRWGGRYGDGNHYEWADGWEWEPLP